MRFWPIWGALCCGCSFVIDLEGPGFTDPPPALDQRLDLTVLDAAIIDAEPPDMPIDAEPDQPPPPPVFELRTAVAAPVLVHTAAGDVRQTLDAAEEFIVETAEGEALTARFEDTLMTLMTVSPGGFAALRPTLSSGSSSTMRLQLGSRFEGADSYAISNGCRHLPCEGESCGAFFTGELSLPVSARCTDDARVGTLAIALTNGAPQAWKQADDPLPADNEATVEFGDWNETFERVEVQSIDTNGARLYAAPWNATPYITHLTTRSARGRRVFRIPAGYAPAVELGLEGPENDGPTQQIFRWWRALPVDGQTILGRDRLLPVPEVRLTPDEAGRPTIEWSGSASADTLARLEFVWEVEDERFRWIIFAAANRGVVQLPALPEEWARWRPDADAVIRSAQVRWVRCKDNAALADHYQTPCALYGPTSRPAQVGDWLSWSVGAAE